MTIDSSSVNGILLFDKPSGQSANQALQRVRHLLLKAKAGHCGTLDPMATGMLPICFGSATKVIEYLLAADKCYEAVLELGSATDTGDKEGQVVAEQLVPGLSQDLLDQVLSKFQGEISQIPPMYSALKREGKPLYQLARQGITVERAPRSLQIKKIEAVLLAPNRISLTVLCSKGTYIRVLAEDIAKSLGTLGHLTMLRRLYTAGCEGQKLCTLEELSSLSVEERLGLLHPIDAFLSHIPLMALSEVAYRQLKHGQLCVLSVPDGQYRAYQGSHCCAILEVTAGLVTHRKWLGGGELGS